ncbi:MAG: hypothetical protein LBH98_02715 [Chitinispirillales bacterium]|nr:hypothetical protein [Chitinispirillales bacterium]
MVTKTCIQRAVWHNGGITPQTILWEFGRYYPAASSVEAATAPSRRDVSRYPEDDRKNYIKHSNKNGKSKTVGCEKYQITILRDLANCE